MYQAIYDETINRCIQAYTDDDTDVLAKFEVGNAKAIATPWGETAQIIAFRGTRITELRDVLDDIEAVERPDYYTRGLIHSGFASWYDQIADAIYAHCEMTADTRPNVILTGHSAGGAMAMISCAHLNARMLITYGQPRTGDDVFVASLTPHDGYLRFVNYDDPVPTVPPAIHYTHGGLEICFEGASANPHLYTGDLNPRVCLSRIFEMSIKEHFADDYKAKLEAWKAVAGDAV